MPTGNDKFQAAADAASCAFLAVAGATATRIATVNLLTGNFVLGGTSAAVAGIAVYAFGKTCTWDYGGYEYPRDVSLTCCPPNQEIDERRLRWRYRAWNVSQSVWTDVDIGYSANRSGQYNRGWIEDPLTPGGDGTWHLEPCGVSYQTTGTIPSNFFKESVYRDLHIVPPEESGCDPGTAPFPDPYTYTDPDDGCQMKVSMEGWAVTPDGNYSPVWRMDPILPPAARASGGTIIGGCNFVPTYYYDGGGGGPRGPFPIPPVPGPGDKPDWFYPLLDFLSDLGTNILYDKLEELFEAPLPQYQYKMRAACNYKEDGSFEDYTITLPEEKYSERMLSLQEMQLDFLQQHLLWKTPTCSGCGSPSTGEPVSINWVSYDYSLAGNDRLRKLLTYFDQNNTSLESTVDHWKDFSFEAGSVIVSCCGTPLGKPQVWASSEAEGKRVIAHAAAIAGVDLTDAEWLIGTPRSSRYGQPGTMRVAKNREGYFAISKRDGPSGPTERLKLVPTPGSG